ncbi:MAG: phosphatase PAP2 family protein [Mycobacteriales bacterium]|jgi:membrane-associated phospholipid phosphatase
MPAQGGTGHRRARALLPVVLPAVLLVLVTVDVLAGGPLRWLDWRVHRAVAGTDLPRLPLRAVALLGQRWLTAPIVLAVTVLVAVRRRSWRPLLVTGVTLGTLWVGGQLFKALTGRTAPASGHDRLLVSGAESYPSGHVANAVVSIGLIVLLLTGRRLGVRSWWWAVPAVTGTAVVLLDFHWVTDVLAGALVGALVLQLPYSLPFPPAYPARRRPVAVDVQSDGYVSQ